MVLANNINPGGLIIYKMITSFHMERKDRMSDREE